MKLFSSFFLQFLVIFLNPGSGFNESGYTTRVETYTAVAFFFNLVFEAMYGSSIAKSLFAVLLFLHWKMNSSKVGNLLAVAMLFYGGF